MIHAIAALAMLLLLFAIMLIRNLRCRESLISPAEPAPCAIDIAQAARALAGAVQIPTISQNSVEETDPAPFLRLHDYLYESFPHVHRVMQRETVNT
jgi:carboxypeptidase PM20D1